MLEVVTGGSGSGKSEYAEKLILTYGNERRFYVATMECRDEESVRRIARHRNMRAGKGFQTIECAHDLQCLALEDAGDALLECMSNLVANEMFAGGNLHEAQQTAEKVIGGVKRLYGQCSNLVIVTNEVFSDGAAYDLWTEKYLQCLGMVNCELAKLADRVTEVVYSIPLIKKEGETDR